MKAEEGFQIEAYVEGNAYLTDSVLPDLLRRLLPRHVLEDIEPDLTRVGHDAISSIRSVAQRAYPPRLVQYDHWGKRVDRLETSEAWQELKGTLFKEGIPGIFYERKYGEYSRVYGFAKLFLLVAETEVADCPLSMTDGCARVLELLGTPEMKRDVFPRLISRNPKVALTSGQWMTERPGGSDISMTETHASPAATSDDANWPAYTLNGFKWFSSATDSNVSVALARTGTAASGSRGLSLFLVPLRLPLLHDSSSSPSPTSNGIIAHRLKNKIGTHILPTAELSLNNTTGYLLGNLNEGVKVILPVLYITRLHSAVSGVGYLRKCLAIATAYSRVRAIKAGKEMLSENAVHVAHLADIAVVYRALTHFVFGTIVLMGRSEAGVASEEDKYLLRILSATTKAFVAQKACAAMEEAMTTLGGLGYMEEVGIGKLIRDGLVEKIWEGTTSVMAVDVMRSAKDPKVFAAFSSWSSRIIAICTDELEAQLKDVFPILREGLQEVASAYSNPNASPVLPRPALLLLGNCASALFLLEHAAWAWNTKSASAREVDVGAFKRWVTECGFEATLNDVRKARQTNDERVRRNRDIVYGPKL